MPPCPHFDLKIVQRSKRQSAVAAAAYQSGERLFSEYDRKQKYYSHKSEIVHTEIMLPPRAPPAPHNLPLPARCLFAPGKPSACNPPFRTPCKKTSAPLAVPGGYHPSVPNRTFETTRS